MAGLSFWTGVFDPVRERLADRKKNKRVSALGAGTRLVVHVFARVTPTQAQWCQNSANRMMIGIGTPRSQSRTPRPNPIIRSSQPVAPPTAMPGRHAGDPGMGLHVY